MNELAAFIDSTVAWLPVLVMIALFAAISIVLVMLALRIADQYHLFQRKLVFLELTPPAASDKAPIATQQLFSVLHELKATRSRTDKFLRRRAVFALEIISTKQAGIRYVIGVPAADVSLFEKHIASYLPDIKYQQVGDYLDDENAAHRRVIEFKQTGHYAYPLQTQGLMDEFDPISFLTGSMTKLAPNETIALQVIASPTIVRKANALHKRLSNNEEFVYQLGKRSIPIAGPLANFCNNLLFGIIDGISDMNTSGRTRTTNKSSLQHKEDVNKHIKPARTLSAFEQELAQSVYHKLSQPLFNVSIRVLVIASDMPDLKQRMKTLKVALSVFSVPRFQSLKARKDRLRPLKLTSFSHRLPSLLPNRAAILSSSELAVLYHFPHSQSARTENLVHSLSRTLPAPLSLKGDTQFDIILGRNHHHGSTTDIGLTAQDRERHVYVIGGTGNGKTTMLLYGIVQDIQNGKGLAVVDPHGDLAETILHHVPEERVSDVIYFNPDDLSHPIGLNLLELPEGIIGDDLLREKDLVTESTISVFRKIFSDDDSGGHRIEYVLRNTIQTALTIEGATLFTIFDLLNDPKYRKKIVNKLADKDLQNFWKHEMGKAGDFQRVKMTAGITAKIGRFLFSASAKRILEQPKSTIDFDEVINSGKILICNFSKGLLGEDTSELFGITVLAKLQMASLRRARIQQTERRPFFLYVDEFQNFATTSFVQLLSEARKYKLFLTMAEQSTSQQSDQQMVNVILANVGTVVCFRSGNPEDERLMLPLFSPYIVQGEIANLPSYNFYIRIAAVVSQEPLSGETIVLNESGSAETAVSVARKSRDMYTRKLQGESDEKPIKSPAKTAPVDIPVLPDA